MCGINSESFVTEIVVAAVSNEKFFENMTAEEKVKSVAELYKALYHQIVEDEYDHGHDHGHEHTHDHDHDHGHSHSHVHY